MKKYFNVIIFLLFIILIFLASKMTFAQQTFEGSFLSIGLSYAPSLITPNNILTNISYLYYFGGWFGLGVGMDALYNFNYEDLYLNAFIRFAIRRFYFEGGITYNIIPSPKEGMITFEDTVYPYFGIRFDLIQTETEKGALNINILIGMIWTSIPVMTVDADNFLEAIIADIIANGMGLFLNSFKIGIGLTYTFYLS